VIALLCGWVAAEAAETRVQAALVIAVDQREEAADAAVAEAERLGGWFQSRTPAYVSLRIPVAQSDAFVDTVSAQGKVLDRSLSREDVSQQLADLRARLKAREEVIARYEAVLATASSKGIVSVEQQILAAIQDVERLKGQIRLLESQATMASVDVSFQFRDRQAPANDGTSSFAWLNTLDLQRVVAALQDPEPSWQTKSTVPPPPPGFSAWRHTQHYRATSAEGVLVTVRTVDHDPKADLAFWTEAARERMTAAGYEEMAVETLQASGVDGTLLELAAPLGTEDWTYLIAFFPTPRRIAIVEVAGEVSEVAKERDALVAWMREITP
jgi:hypothetical protein